MVLEHRYYGIEEIGSMLQSGEPLELGQKLTARITKGRAFLEDYIERAEQPIYGINTGFGSLCDTEISSNDLSALQHNLVMSHACGTGARVPREIVKCMLLLKVMGLSKGNSGVRLETVQRLLDFYNLDILPVIYEQGSLGASGDLAPLAHLALPLIGMGEVWQGEDIKPAPEVLAQHNLGALQLQAKEGLALLNGTQFMSSYATMMLFGLDHWLARGEEVAALSFDAFEGRINAFDDAVHAVRPHAGQRDTARVMRELLEGSEWVHQPKKHVQDPYSFRCIPQVHGASRDAIAYVRSVVETEVNAVTDNPTLIPEEDKIISAGNFHGQPLALTLDFISIAMAELASISERRIYKLISGQRDLPPYLVADAGLNSGFMIAQYGAASIVSQNKQLCTPASVDTIDSSNGQEDHVSMGANGATKAWRVFENLQTVISIELLHAAQAADFREGKTSPHLEDLRTAFRQHVHFLKSDEVLHDLIVKSRDFLQTYSLD